MALHGAHRHHEALGDLPEPSMAAEVAELADVAGWPVIAEPFGKYHRGRVTPHGPLILRASQWLDRNRPERVLVAGRVTLDREVAHEEARAGISDTAHFAYPTYARAAAGPNSSAGFRPMNVTVRSAPAAPTRTAPASRGSSP